MTRWLAAAAVLSAVAAPAPGPAGVLERHAPVVVHDSRESDTLTSVRAFAGRVPGVEPGPARPVVYGRRAGPWLPYWMFFAYNAHDRGLLRTGRHEDDWEMVQFRLRRKRPVQAVYAQHSGAESCGYGRVRLAGSRPVVHVARGSHAAYFVSGLRDRTWPDPNDEADGRGERVRPRLVRITERRPEWMRYRGRWGGSRAGWVPGEMDSPRGPGVPAAGPLDRPGRLGRRRAAVHARGLRRARRVRRARDRDGGDPGGAGPAGGGVVRRAPDAEGGLSPGAGIARAAHAAARCPDSCHGVRIRGPSAVIATVNSKCAASEPSWE